MSLDITWLNSLRFQDVAGGSVHGYLGHGGENVALRSRHPQHGDTALSTYRHWLAWHIKEIPPALVNEKMYKVESVCEKLFQLVGIPGLDASCYHFGRLNTLVMKLIRDNGVPNTWVGSQLNPLLADGFQVLLFGEGIQRRLGELACLEDAILGRSQMPRINFPGFPFFDHTEKLREWANKCLEDLREIDAPENDLRPKTLCENPLYIFSAAVLDGFFDQGELTEVVRLIKERFGDLVRSADVGTFSLQICSIIQTYAALSLAKTYEYVDRVKLSVQLCAMLGFCFEIVGPDGCTIASGFDELHRRG